ncbi:metaxin-2-like [Paramacrobiotus metropolitanus]|uniref:metaxin-2-like n=1 Tax=Paramacrobiotus metropolitanus TaxID=2943436 RepID=UPI002445ED85|nr:metaxin-2-like [Paramacrobiotus metropolitanus]XP_055334633.1 metaxin-2-like [Paramacrobiotus metropolitanus]XP_055334634.1 metaxin-2-like [Paramacrobiotus metropolitanus]XP_055334635.1 metaxin-2-like [Paramacrobiotus metropolitanus]
MDFIFKPFMFTNDLVEEPVEVVVNAGDLPWPTDAILCVPPLGVQVTLHEQAECLATQAFLRMHGLKFVLDERSNAEFISVSGKLPLLKVENHFVAGFDAITAYARLRIRQQLTNEQEGSIRPYVEMIQITVKNAELYAAWLDDANYKAVTKDRYGSPYPAPLNKILPFLKRLQIKAYLMEMSPLRSIEDVRESLLSDLRALSERLGPRPYFLDDVHTNELDALAFGHLSALLTCHLPEGNLSELVQRHQNLVAFCQRVDRLFFAKELGLNTELYNATVVTGMRRLPPMLIKSDI